MGEHRPTLVRPPPQDTSKAPIENALELTDLSVIGPDIFTNTRELWHPPGARGIYGGAVIAQTLAAAQRTVPADFVVHSFHCFFVLAGDSGTPILYHVERVREGRSFATRTVQARQRGRPIFTVTCSFVREGSGGARAAAHAAVMPAAAEPPPPDDYDAARDPEQPSWRAGDRDEDDGSDSGDDEEAENDGKEGGDQKQSPTTTTDRQAPTPFETYRIRVVGGEDTPPHAKKAHQWVRARGRISAEGGHQAHLSALAYISDSNFIGTVGRFHRLWRFPVAVDDVKRLPAPTQRHLARLVEWEGSGSSVEAFRGRPSIGMMVSLDHTIYFHNPKKVRADEWMFTETESPWAGDGRGVVTQRMFSKDGTLLATCFQEGVVRLKQDEDAKAKL